MGRAGFAPGGIDGNRRASVGPGTSMGQGAPGKALLSWGKEGASAGSWHAAGPGLSSAAPSRVPIPAAGRRDPWLAQGCPCKGRGLRSQTSVLDVNGW